MSNFNDQVVEFTLLTNTPNLSFEDLKKASQQLVDISKALDEKLVNNNSNEEKRAIGSITSIANNTFSQISTKPSDLYEMILQSAKEALPGQLPVYTQLFGQVDVFRTKLIEASKYFSPEEKEEILRMQSTYQKDKILKTTQKEITSMAAKIKRDMLDVKIEKDGWLDPVNTAQALKLLNDQFDSITKAIQKNPLLTQDDKKYISAQMEQTKKEFRQTITQLSPSSKDFIKIIDNSSLDLGKLQAKTQQVRKVCIEASLKNLQNAITPEQKDEAIKEAQLLRYELKNLNLPAIERAGLKLFSYKLKRQLNDMGSLNTHKVILPETAKLALPKLTKASLLQSFTNSMVNTFNKVSKIVPAVTPSFKKSSNTTKGV